MGKRDRRIDAYIAKSPDFARPILTHVREVVHEALGFVSLGTMRELMKTMARLVPSLHPLLDRAPFAPRRWDTTLIWPLEAPMLHPSVFPLFREVRIESALPIESEVRSSA